MIDALTLLAFIGGYIVVAFLFLVIGLFIGFQYLDRPRHRRSRAGDVASRLRGDEGARAVRRVRQFARTLAARWTDDVPQVRVVVDGAADAGAVSDASAGNRHRVRGIGAGADAGELYGSESR